MKRARMSRKASRKNFRQGSKTAVVNLTTKPLRGGWRF